MFNAIKLYLQAKDNTPTLWIAETGERMGTYNGHGGAVWDLDPTWDSVFLITAGADSKVILWEVETGVELITYPHSGPVRSVCFNEAGTRFVSCCDLFSGEPPCVTVYVRSFSSLDFLYLKCDYSVRSSIGTTLARRPQSRFRGTFVSLRIAA
jgi:WD40 repeat protein